MSDANVEVKYPRWVQPDSNIGAILCLNAQDEAKVLSDHKARKPSESKAEKK